MHLLFVYGTLMLKEIADKVIGFHSNETASLSNYKRYKIFSNNYELPYPAVIYKKNALTQGILFRNINDQYLDLLDQYEGEDYERILLNVNTKAGICDAWVYVWKNPPGTKLLGNWNVEEFRKNFLDAYLNSEEF